MNINILGLQNISLDIWKVKFLSLWVYLDLEAIYKIRFNRLKATIQSFLVVCK